MQSASILVLTGPKRVTNTSRAPKVRAKKNRDLGAEDGPAEKQDIAQNFVFTTLRDSLPVRCTVAFKALMIRY